MDCAQDELLARIAELDRKLFATVPGEELQAAGLLADRRTLVAMIVEEATSLSVLSDLQDRTARLGEKFLHWRRTSIMELSLIEQNLRYLSAQNVKPSPLGSAIEVLG